MKITIGISSVLLMFTSICASATTLDNVNNRYSFTDNNVENNPYKKRNETIVIKESKKTDEVLQADLDALLDEFMDDMNNSSTLLGTEEVINSAFNYSGVRYRFGGTSFNGIDCSGLVMNAFANTEINLPRSSREMAQVGEKIKRSQAQKGDLIFFKTRGNRISHVGIITEVVDGEIKFIHSSTSKGVIVSSTNEAYYKTRFAQINRVLSTE